VEDIMDILDKYALDEIQIFIEDYTISPHLLNNLSEYMHERTKRAL